MARNIISTSDNYASFNRGIKTEPFSAGRPCEQFFLNAIVCDLERWSVKLFEVLPVPINTHIPLSTSSLADQVLDPQVKAVMRHLTSAMDECVRLHSAQDIFPSESSKVRFFKQVSHIASAWDKFTPILKDIADDISLDFRALGLNTERVGRSVCRPSVEDLPRWHPRNGACKTWNKWMDNLEVNKYPCAGGQKMVRHQVPEVGMRMLHRTTYMYSVIETNYELGQRVVREWPSDHQALSQATGEDHGDIVQIIQYERVNIAKELGILEDDIDEAEFMAERVNGVITLEYLSRALAQAFARQIKGPNSMIMSMVISRN